MTTNQETAMLNTNEAAKLLGVRPDAVHAMKAAGRLSVVGKGPNGCNLFAAADVQATKRERELRARRSVPAQEQLPHDPPSSCPECALWRERALAAESREKRVRASLDTALGM
ncbi:hypothetical protein [Streptomyces altiplanensis]